MIILSKRKDGGPISPVEAYFLIEWKSFFSIAVLKFKKGGREAFHSHAFDAFTWFLSGEIYEERLDGCIYKYKRGILPKVTKRDNCHRVTAKIDSWCLTVRGPWSREWFEVVDNKLIRLTHGRKVLSIEPLK